MDPDWSIIGSRTNSGPRKDQMATLTTAEAQIKIRLPADVRDRVKASAALNRRTLMREIEFRVIESLDREAAQSSGVAMGGAAQ